MPTAMPTIRAPQKSFRLRFFHSDSSSRPIPARRHFSIECKGKPISREDLFNYTNDRSLGDEKVQCSKRHIRSDIDKLCDVIASVSGSDDSSVSRIEKFEGGFSKALLVTREDESEYIVKIPCPNARRPMYCTASLPSLTRTDHLVKKSTPQFPFLKF